VEHFISFIGPGIFADDFICRRAKPALAFAPGGGVAVAAARVLFEIAN